MIPRRTKIRFVLNLAGFRRNRDRNKKAIYVKFRIPVAIASSLRSSQ
jgi:hypothetical protein